MGIGRHHRFDICGRRTLNPIEGFETISNPAGLLSGAILSFSIAGRFSRSGVILPIK